mgnify:CR=1 FL=1
MLQPHTQLVFVILQNTITGIPDHIQVIAYPEIHVSPRLVFFGFFSETAGSQQDSARFEGSRNRPVAIPYRLFGDRRCFHFGQCIDFRRIAHDRCKIFFYGYFPPQRIGTYLCRQEEWENRYD